MNQHHLSEQDTTKITKSKQFKFGANWEKFLRVLDDTRIEAAKNSLKNMLEMKDLEGKSFLDIGAGSGLFSLAARLLGAHVYSFDYDSQAVETTAELKRRYFYEDNYWIIQQGTILNQDYLNSLGQFDIVYAWGVLHHTGAMWQALENVIPLVKPGGILFISIYNDQRGLSKYWAIMKRLYNQNVILKITISIGHLPWLAARVIVRVFTRRLKEGRGMSLWYNYFDWLGGYPFEVAKPEEIFDFYRMRGLMLTKLKTCGGRAGCNEFIFVKTA